MCCMYANRDAAILLCSRFYKALAWDSLGVHILNYNALTQAIAYNYQETVAMIIKLETKVVNQRVGNIDRIH